MYSKSSSGALQLVECHAFPECGAEPVILLREYCRTGIVRLVGLPAELVLRLACLPIGASSAPWSSSSRDSSELCGGFRGEGEAGVFAYFLSAFFDPRRGAAFFDPPVVVSASLSRLVWVYPEAWS